MRTTFKPATEIGKQIRICLILSAIPLRRMLIFAAELVFGPVHL